MFKGRFSFVQAVSLGEFFAVHPQLKEEYDPNEATKRKSRPVTGGLLEILSSAQ